MKKFFVRVSMSYIQEVEVEAETKEDAEIKAYEEFDMMRAYQADGECWSYEKKDGVEYDWFGAPVTEGESNE